MSQLHTLHELAGAEQALIRSGAVLQTGMPSGVGLEKLVPGGVPVDKVTMVFADEGGFKTTLITQMQWAMASVGPVVNVSLEDSAQLCAHRLLGRLSGVSFGRIHGGTLSPDERCRVGSAALSEVMRNMHIVDDVEPRIERCFAAAKAVAGCRALFIDYIQLLEGPYQKTTLDEALRACQRFAIQTKIAVVLVSQRKTIDMEGPRRDNPRPVSSDMFGSSSMRMCAKLAVGLFRPWSYCKVPTSVKGPYGPYAKWLSSAPDNIDIYPYLLEVHCTKNFAGPPGAYVVRVYPDTGIIEPFYLEFA